MIRLNDILDRVLAYNPEADTELLRRAYVFSAKVHQGQTRASGEPYLIHPLGVAMILAELQMDTDTVVTGLLHDTVEDTWATTEEIERLFGSSVKALVEGVTKIGKIEFRSKAESQAENFRKMLLAMSEDIRVIIVKLADRLHNMRTIEHLPPIKQAAIAEETLEIYAPLAHRLGISVVKNELEDLCLKALKPEVYLTLKEKVALKKKEREKYIEEVSGILHKALVERQIAGEVTGRPKHFYSIYQKMEQQKLVFEQVYDLVAFRIVTNTVRDCYELLGVIHSLWKPVPGRFKDYIAMPKGNGYQSLHTTVIGPGGQRVEIQIRTLDMHRVAEAGIAAHWKYKEKGEADNLDDRDGMRFAWLRQLVEWHKNLEDPAEFMETVKIDLFADEVYVFTPAGEVKSFPKGATPIDFAYKVHSEIGDHCVGAKVGGRIVPLRYELRNGDTIEILTSPTARPTKDWLKLARTSGARQKIRHYVRKAERERSRQLGFELLEKELKRHEYSLAKLLKDGEIDALADSYGHKTTDEFFSAVGFGRIQLAKVLPKIVPEEVLSRAPREETPFEKLVKKVTGRATSSAVTVKGIDDMLVRFGRCCNPIPGDEIIGFITRGRGVTIHNVKCATAMSADPARRVEVTWGGGKTDADAGTRPVRIRVLCIDKPGILADISKSISGEAVNIKTAQIRTTRDNKATGLFEVTVKNTQQLHQVMHAVGKVKGVISVARM
jgi:GTP pyrophosphokinase